ncbi:MAG: 50S ribosomal protein L25 [Solirubrobacteraceae bacterium]
MARSETTALVVASRDTSGSRQARRLRRTGNVPGVVYGGGEDPLAFAVDARELRHALATAGAVFDLSIDGSKTTPVVVKELVRHPVSGETTHLDLIRVRLDQAIQATVVLELTGTDTAPGVREGGVLEHVTRELTVEALPTEIPDTLEHDVSEMQVGDTLTLGALRAPGDVMIVGDPEMVIATLTPPRLQTESDTEIEAETEVVGESSTRGESDSGSDHDSGDAAGGGDEAGSGGE